MGKTQFADRGAHLNALADALDKRADEWARLLTREQGKPLVASRQEIDRSIAFLRYNSTLAMPHKTLRDNETGHVVETREPLGVVVAIAPWNSPVWLLMMKIAPALLSGNTLVAKPAPTTPLSTLFLGEIASSVLPRGVLNVITCGNDLAEKLTCHPDVAKVSFTGSTRTGVRVLQNASNTLKRVTLELGGNDAAIVLDDVNIDEVAPKVFMAAMANSGQICFAAKRVYAPRAIYDRLCDALAALAKKAVVGNGMEPSTQLGPIQNRAQYERVKDLIEDSRRQGTIIAGGTPLDGPGYFIPPTIVRDLPDDARLVREEQFGPVLPVLAYDDVDELIERVNDTEYGLAGTIWAKDTERAFEIARRVDTGTMWINCFMNLSFDVPIGGAKQSGMGWQLGQQGLEEFTQLKIISMVR
ncbi:aldehyde dehydrogenase family protein [Paraburkholderia humisilvae]|uniref:Geranial dehydrogenase n=1 Tax=Paraburkholderia humisilvae TaxID=627669 RepID=A0A6J5ED52_9BURK|nr:aldehyde dehydrogenase family protein [Paraburkholderia humisilvae]CAB3763241.1 Geranial dehydrogenase [Paraburkholderia humisilvae]